VTVDEMLEKCIPAEEDIKASIRHKCQHRNFDMARYKERVFFMYNKDNKSLGMLVDEIFNFATKPLFLFGIVAMKTKRLKTADKEYSCVSLFMEQEIATPLFRLIRRDLKVAAQEIFPQELFVEHNQIKSFLSPKIPSDPKVKDKLKPSPKPADSDNNGKGPAGAPLTAKQIRKKAKNKKRRLLNKQKKRDAKGLAKEDTKPAGQQ